MRRTVVVLSLLAMEGAARAEQVPVTVLLAGNGGGKVTGNLVGGSGAAVLDCSLALGGTCSTSPTAGTTLALRAIPAPNSIFKGWSSQTGGATACTGTTSPCTFVPGGPSSLRATFDIPKELTMSVKLTPKDAGLVRGNVVGASANFIDTRGDVNPRLTEGKEVHFFAQAVNSNTTEFKRWSDASGSAVPCRGSTNPNCTFTLGQDSLLVAEFGPKPQGPFTLTVSTGQTPLGRVVGKTADGVTVIDCGLSSSNVCSVTLPAPRQVTLTATPGTGALFTAWSQETGDAIACSRAGRFRKDVATCAFELTRASSVKANFVPDNL